MLPHRSHSAQQTGSQIEQQQVARPASPLADMSYAHGDQYDSMDYEQIEQLTGCANEAAEPPAPLPLPASPAIAPIALPAAAVSIGVGRINCDC